MSTQAFIKIEDNRNMVPEMIWVNHDAFPEEIIPLIRNVDFTKATVNVFNQIIHELETKNIDYTVEKTLNQDMNYVYLIEIWGDGDVYLRTQKEFWVDEDNFDVPSSYLFCEMRTVSVDKLS